MCMSWTKDASHKFESYFDALLLESDNFSFKKNMYNALIYIVIINFGNNNWQPILGFDNAMFSVCLIKCFIFVVPFWIPVS